ncbi:zinc finger MYM-type protein 1-like [Arachis ipaensis]|uniref:zinc finger MYM-type protein 1-like n=1 Tax=Arachis ipaensis TaxID=130454 RepID=UPI000A2B33DF|nr:zinc finger MYM-type protein 1-like [Arachis ipaensis]
MEKNAFSELGFSNWKKVNNGVNCAFVCHEGSIPNSPHNLCVKSCDDLMAQSKHIDKVLDRHSDETIANNRLRLKTSINTIRWLAFQACAFRGDDESLGSLNRGNFIELIKLLASCNQNVNNVVLENAPGNAQYISPGVQKDILHIFARKVRATIREEIGDSKFCIIIDEARDESKREQMSVVLRFVDKHGCVQERFFDLIHVSDTCSLTLKTEISLVLSRYNLDVQNLRGQGYDGANCPFAYYIHCLAHQLQLALVSAAKEVCYVHQFISKLTLIVNVVTVSPKYDQEKFHIRMQAQHYELDVPNHVELTNLCTISELCQGLTKTGKSLTYPLIDHLIRLVLTFPVSTATTERSFSAMNIVKNRLRNKMDDELLANCL